jgi:hypothetical protein
MQSAGVLIGIDKEKPSKSSIYLGVTACTIPVTRRDLDSKVELAAIVSGRGKENEYPGT